MLSNILVCSPGRPGGRGNKSPRSVRATAKSGFAVADCEFSVALCVAASDLKARAGAPRVVG
jgi:hypothetical protein